MRTRLDNMGPVNMMALEEYKETAERTLPRNPTPGPVIPSRTQLRPSRRSIPYHARSSRGLPPDQRNFQLIFRRLFGGGHAFMRLTDEETARKAVSTWWPRLRAETAERVAAVGRREGAHGLVAAGRIFQYAPSPFCILDEVDAPLDEANIGRFTELVKEMSVKLSSCSLPQQEDDEHCPGAYYGVTISGAGCRAGVGAVRGDGRKGFAQGSVATRLAGFSFSRPSRLKPHCRFDPISC